MIHTFTRYLSFPNLIKSIYKILLSFTNGLLDSFHYFQFYDILIAERFYRIIYFKYVFLNIILLCFVHFVFIDLHFYIFDYLSILLSSYNKSLSIFQHDSYIIYTFSIFNYYKLVIYIIYIFFWFLPITAIRFIINFKRGSHMADFVCLKNDRPLKMSNVIASKIFELIFIFWLLTQEFIFSYIPYIGPINFYILGALDWSYIIFDYKWSSSNLPTTHKLLFFKEHWIYFLGFGTFPSLIQLLLPFPYGSGITSILTPALVFIVNIIDEDNFTKDYILFDIFDIPIFFTEKTVDCLLHYKYIIRKISYLYYNSLIIKIFIFIFKLLRLLRYIGFGTKRLIDRINTFINFWINYYDSLYSYTKYLTYATTNFFFP